MQSPLNQETLSRIEEDITSLRADHESQSRNDEAVDVDTAPTVNFIFDAELLDTNVYSNESERSRTDTSQDDCNHVPQRNTISSEQTVSDYLSAFAEQPANDFDHGLHKNIKI